MSLSITPEERLVVVNDPPDKVVVREVGLQGLTGPQGPQGPASSTVAGTLGAVATFPQNASSVEPGGRKQHWMRFGTVTITTRYADWHGRLLFQGAFSGATFSSHMLVLVRIKQQAEFGSAPVMSAVVIDALNNVSTDIALVPVELTFTATSVGVTKVDCYFRNTNNTFEGYNVFSHGIIQPNGTSMAWRTGALLADYSPTLPTGVSPTATSSKLPAFT